MVFILQITIHGISYHYGIGEVVFNILLKYNYITYPFPLTASLKSPPSNFSHAALLSNW